MKAGDVCRCITAFTGVLAEEITVFKNDIVQVHSVVDRHWLQAEGGGAVGRVPSSVLVKTELPQHPYDRPLFIAAADFQPAQAGDLGFQRGDFIVGLNPIDEAWWCGEIYGKKGIFPLNFVWKINKDIIEVEDSSEKPVRMKACVKMSIRAQLPEELDLYSGDIVNITHIVDKDWYRGESNGATGIFPSNFVEILETNTTSSPSALEQKVNTPQEFFPPTGNTIPCSDYLTEDIGNTFASTDVQFNSNASHTSYGGDNTSPAAVMSQKQVPTSEPPAALSKTSAHWKTIDASDDMDILEDDYFKQNMPGLFSPSTSSKNTSTHAGDSQFIIPPESFTNINTRYENVLDPVSTENSYLNSVSTSDSYSVNTTGNIPVEGTCVKHRYENVKSEDSVNKTSSYRYENSFGLDSDTPVNDIQLSALTDAQDLNADGVLNSLSQKVDDYFSQNQLNESVKNDDVFDNNNTLFKQFNTLSSPGYNEDNTGIEPYGRAVFSFKAQYPNELTFRKGDIIHLLKHVDSHWTLGSVGNSKGIFPTSYVDIIVNCLHSEEEMFLARSESLVQSSYIGHAKAEYNFEGVQSGDVTMSKGDILKVIKYVDDNWVIVENVNGSKGMCPKNYISMLIELVPDSNNSLPASLDSVSEESSDRVSRQLIQSTSSSRSRSTSPYNTAGSRRSYNKDDFGSIKKQEVESVLAKNIASLDVACKSTPTEKRGSESIFTEREKDKHEVKPGALPSIPPRISTRPRSATVCGVAPSSVSKSKSSTTSTVTTKPAVAPRNFSVPPVPPRVKVGRSNSTKSVSDQDSLNSSATTNEKPVAAVPEQKKVQSQEEVTSPEPIYAKIQKPQVQRKSSAGKLQSRILKKESSVSGAPLTRGDSANSASFPDDISTASLGSEGTFSSEAQSVNTSLPQRPAPPPPPKISECSYEETEDYYSLPTEAEENITSAQYPQLEAGAESPKPAAATSVSAHIENKPSSASNDAVYDVAEGEGASIQECEAKASARINMRRELMQEIVTTEHEYIHDLEALMQVIRLAPSQRESQAVDLDTLMGNISQVVTVAKKLLSHLDSVAYESDENLRIGRVFLLCAPDLCDIYKIYCSNHNVAAEPLLKKYTEEPVAAAFLQWVLSELQQHKIQLMDMRSVLIKPVQRVLKYPLFLDRLVSETPPDHPDYQDLVEAKSKMANVAKEVNEYTKRLDLINKYRNAADQSLQSKMQRVTMHSVAKKSARISAIVSEKLGIMATTKDPEFDEEETKFRCIQRASLVLVQDAEVLLQAVKARHKAELEISSALVATLIEGAKTPEMEAIQQATMDTCSRLLYIFENFVSKRIIQPVSQLMSLCDVPERLIVKRYHKQLDFDNAQYKLDRNKDPTRTRILEEELSQVKGNYDALNTQLMMELPVLTSAGMEILTLSMRSLIAARMYLQGHLAKLYLHLAQIPGLSYTGEEEMLAQFRVKYLQQVGEFRNLSFIPTESLQRSLPRPKTRGKKSLDNTTAKKDGQEGTKRKVLSKYPAEVIYVVTEVHTPGEVMELTLYPGDHVALLKNKDPLGRSERWFVDDGDNKGFARVSCLKPLQGTDNRVGSVTALPSSINTAVPLPTQANPTAAPRPSTLPRAAPTPPLPERPPRYEDLFPTVIAAAPRPPHVVGYRTGGRQAPPPRYSMGQEVHVLPAQTPLPSKPGHVESSSDANAHLHVSESDHYSPPLDRQQSNEYNSPVSEESNIYEEIDQGKEPTNRNGVEESDSSPIYEVIDDHGLSQQDPGSYANTGASVLPESDCEEPQFYYALYNFGGSDCTQLNLTAGQVVLVVQAKSSDWWFVEDRNGNQGYVPASYLTKYS